MRGQSGLAATLPTTAAYLTPANAIWHAAAPARDLASATAANENSVPPSTFEPERIAGWCAS